MKRGKKMRRMSFVAKVFTGAILIIALLAVVGSQPASATDACDCPLISIDNKGCISGCVTKYGTTDPVYGKYVFLRMYFKSAHKPGLWKRGKVYRTKTDGDGCYMFYDLPRGMYDVFTRGCTNLRGSHHLVDLINNGRTVNEVNFMCRMRNGIW